MYDRDKIARLVDEIIPEHSLPRAFYQDTDVYEFDTEEVLPRSWLMIGFEAELPEPGAYLSLIASRHPIIVVRGRDGVVRGFHNVCRHRGSMICPVGHGKTPRLTCPYHKWTYDLSGRLIAAPRSDDGCRFDEHGLRPIHVRLLSGCIYVALGADPPSFDPFERAARPLLDPYRMQEGKLAHESVLIEKANWKLVMENARECHHCRSGHPEFSHVFPVQMEPGLTYGNEATMREYEKKIQKLGLSAKQHVGPWWLAGRYPLNPGMESVSMDGKPLVQRPLVEFGEREVGGMWWATQNNFCHALCDHAFMFSVLPLGPQESAVVSKWLVHKEAIEGVDYTVDELVEIWTKTNLQDRTLAETNQRGVSSPAYLPGPYSKLGESDTLGFVNWYRDQVRSLVHPGQDQA